MSASAVTNVIEVVKYATAVWTFYSHEVIPMPLMTSTAAAAASRKVSSSLAAPHGFCSLMADIFLIEAFLAKQQQQWRSSLMASELRLWLSAPD